MSARRSSSTMSPVRCSCKKRTCSPDDKEHVPTKKNAMSLRGRLRCRSLNPSPETVDERLEMPYSPLALALETALGSQDFLPDYVEEDFLESLPPPPPPSPVTSETPWNATMYSSSQGDGYSQGDYSPWSSDYTTDESGPELPIYHPYVGVALLNRLVALPTAGEWAFDRWDPTVPATVYLKDMAGDEAAAEAQTTMDSILDDPEREARYEALGQVLTCHWGADPL
ncbi:uncharacterized protein K452DRAFT_153240 [Aplosporella prunicola CBS 121167]|uniref:Uncharacterized protein n=1 Tax=Aplosporella prunicola CBS 121167 TaxID=1176127 RepID=A0A6A6BIZ1_9PEZI|nr:uncharacterized protein K452DRAFT_153240 [Aplosporella prunicola CBS 121167]KAF2144110.1 hypothetical protein K452DRAFT_153240 [Aplosporella prunicola CBS 121167]